MPYKNKTFFRTYQDLEQLFSKCRNPNKGKPLSTWCRLFRVGNDFYLTINGFRFAKVTPDNIFEFLMTQHQGRSVSVTLSGSLHYCTPMFWYRKSMGRYRVIHEGVNGASLNWAVISKKSVDYFQGIKFDLNTGECVNARPDLLSTVNTDVRKVWLRKIKTFKRGLRVRVKMGVFETIAKDLLAETNFNFYNKADWTSEEWIDELYKAIQNQQYPTELLREMVASSMSRWRPLVPSATDFYHNIDIILNNTSLLLRQKFGVFEVIEGEAA